MNPLATRLATFEAHPEDRKLLDKIASRYSHSDARGCLFVTGGNHSNGRPQIGVNYTKMRIARFIVAVRDELDMLGEWDTRHTCNVRACVNPDHLLSGTRQDNALDRYAQGTAPIGERAPNARLTHDDVREVHRLASSMKQARIADRFRVSTTTISNILNGVTWRHVYDEMT
ncbi:hypothetical protein [Ruegeria sp.]|uniref:hypothetical protein n=1 Tax=Ruegeria sp. TaxID=1879320 RepID=UPI003B0029C7